MPRTLSGYQLHMSNVLKDKTKTFTQAVEEWRALDEDKRNKLKSEASAVEAKPRKKRVAVAAAEPAPVESKTSLDSAPVEEKPKRVYKKKVAQ